MAQGGSGLSRFSPFNLFFDEVSSASGERNQMKAMKLWNNLDPEKQRIYELRSEYIKESFKTAAYQPDDDQAKPGVDRGVNNVERLRSVLGGEIGRPDGLEDSLRRSMKLICLQYSAHYQKRIEKGVSNAGKRAGAVPGGVQYETRYLPNEVAVVTFSFVGGIEKETHFFVQIPPEDIPAYCKAEMKERYQLTHFIPFEEDDIRLNNLTPIAPVASKVLEKMLGDIDGEDETLTFCLSADRDMFQGSVKTLLDYVPSQDNAQYFRRKMSKTCDLEDLFRLLSSYPDRCRREVLTNKFKDQFVDDSQSSCCRCDYHRGREETEIHCALLRGHSALHLVFDTLGKELELRLTQRHIHVDKKQLARCSASHFADFPEEAPEEEQEVWAKRRSGESFDVINNLEDDSPRAKQWRCLNILLDPSLDACPGY